MVVSIIKCCLAFDKMNVFPISHINGRTRGYFYLVEVIKKVCSCPNLMYVAFPFRYGLTGYSGKTMVMYVSILIF